MLSFGQEKVSRLAEGRPALEVFEAKKDGSRSNTGDNRSDNGSEVVPSKFLSQFASFVGALSCIGDRVLITSIMYWTWHCILLSRLRAVWRSWKVSHPELSKASRN